eukprot:2202265-Pyramimonas_sp.AAC.1
MNHEHIATSMTAQGVGSGLVAAHLRELAGIRATIQLPGVGSTTPFDYSKGGKQGGIETPDEWNALADYLMEPLIQARGVKGFGFKLDLGDGDVYVNHVWCDSVVLFAADQVSLSMMINDITRRFHEHELHWKPGSLDILPGG